jgi:hypothetical protein
MSQQRDHLEFRKQQLLRQITESLYLLQGSLHKNPSQRGWHLTTKDARQVTRTRYVRADLAPLIREMTRNHLKVRQLLARLSEVHWRLLQLPPED